MIKKVIQWALLNLGYKIVKLRNSNFNKVGFNTQYLSSVCTPDLVIDVGVGYGTFPLYEAFPQASFILIEPQVEYEEHLNKIAEKYSSKIVMKALGHESGLVEMNYDNNRLQKASFFKRTALTVIKAPVQKKMIEVTTLDVLLENEQIEDKSILLKIDTEGGELSVLKGSKLSLQYIDFVIAEVSIAKRFDDSYEFEELVFFMKDNGFTIFSFLTMKSFGGESRQRFTDILFKKISLTK